jgi:micrococcal nuclease
MNYRLVLMFAVIGVIIFISGCVTGETTKSTGNLEQVQIESKQESTTDIQSTPESSPSLAPTPTPDPTSVPQLAPESIPTPEPISTVTVQKGCKGTFEGVVKRIIDGDTLSIEGCDSNIRLSLVNTPESYESGYTQANSFVSSLCKAGSTINVDQDDNQPYDKYGRIVALVYCQNKKLNAELLYNRLAIIDTRFCSTSEFANEEWAKSYGCEVKITENKTLKNCFSITNFHYDAEGNDNYNLNDEYVTIKNSCDFEIDMTSWIIRDEATHVYTLPTFIFNPKTTFTFYTGTGTDTSTELYWGRTTGAVWNNDGDTLYLKDSNGNLIFSQGY